MVRPRGLALALALVVLTLVGCAADESPTPAPGSTSSGDEGSSATPDTGGSDNPPTEPSLRPGQVALGFEGGSDAPRVVVNMEPGYETFGGFALLAGRGNQFRGLGLWNAVEVATHPCRNREWQNPGPSVKDLAEALANQPLRDATDPVAASLDGYPGLRLTLNVPADLRPGDCDLGAFQDWRSSPASPHWHPEPDTRDRVWILDVEGHRLLIHAFHGGGSSVTQVAGLTRMVRTLKFVAQIE